MAGFGSPCGKARDLRSSWSGQAPFDPVPLDGERKIQFSGRRVRHFLQLDRTQLHSALHCAPHPLGSTFSSFRLRLKKCPYHELSGLELSKESEVLDLPIILSLRGKCAANAFEETL
ncbi:hypothetical protein AVEN_236094-1 [Araneus ventricosus]|uniref:Uncharacterized protein n=1 Tax=Araneus ventricosus TaxID=182803 RepID=A0A4Y2HK01_ARAVE|nr:hypothetical protein AVEN_236094-1 [Araneus ventricosus]